MTRIRTWVIAATTRGTNHYTITAARPATAPDSRPHDSPCALLPFWPSHNFSPLATLAKTAPARLISARPSAACTPRPPVLHTEAVVAEWLRRLTRNQFPSGSAGSSPTDCVIFEQFLLLGVSSLDACLGVGRPSAAGKRTGVPPLPTNRGLPARSLDAGARRAESGPRVVISLLDWPPPDYSFVVQSAAQPG